MEIITGVERRRRWSFEEELRTAAGTEQPGIDIAEIARMYEISRGLLCNWRSQVRRDVLRPL
jgi:transposase